MKCTCLANFKYTKIIVLGIIIILYSNNPTLSLIIIQRNGNCDLKEIPSLPVHCDIFHKSQDIKTN